MVPTRTRRLVAAIVIGTVASCSGDSSSPTQHGGSGDPPVTITTATSLPDGVSGTAYTATLAATGGTGSFTWSVSSGTLPVGLTLGASTGIVSGIPLAAGTFAFSVQVASGSQNASRALALTIAQGQVLLSWPLAGIDGRDWVVENYVDLDPSADARDYTGAMGDAAKTYDTHNGVDIAVPNFRWMDGSLAIARAAAPGVVIATHDNEPDRHTACFGTPNSVNVLQADGLTARYLHFKDGSVAVNVGQQVSVGTRLGVVGSSGCSTGPHLHFELRDRDNRVVDPFLNHLWASPPVYETPLAFMDAVLRAGEFTSYLEVEDPAPNVTSLPRGSVLGVGVSVAGGHPGDVVRVVITTPAGTVHSDDSRKFTATYRHSYWYWNKTLSAATGAWTVSIYVNGVLGRSYTVTVT